MMPPSCDVCRRPFKHSGFEYEDFTLVNFRPTRTYPDDWAGHPDHCVWFCPSHLPLSEGLTHLPAGEALALILANLRETTDAGSQEAGAEPPRGTRGE